MSKNLEERTFGNQKLAKAMRDYAIKHGENVKTITVKPYYILKVIPLCREIYEANKATDKSTLNFKYTI